MVRTIVGNRIRPSRNAAAASSFAALYTRGQATAPLAGLPRQLDSREDRRVQRLEVPGRRGVEVAGRAAAGTRDGQPSASAIGSFISGGLA